jgi:hypothetical protein
MQLFQGQVDPRCHCWDLNPGSVSGIHLAPLLLSNCDAGYVASISTPHSEETGHSHHKPPIPHGQ